MRSSPDLPWTAFLPGAVVLGLGLEAPAYSPRTSSGQLANASDLYGALGIASTLLFYLFLIGAASSGQPSSTPSSGRSASGPSRRPLEH
jgi:hypothetical protein